MDIDDILLDIEEVTDRTSRCIYLTEVVLYLKEIKARLIPIDTGTDWKNKIHFEISKDVSKNLDKSIDRITNLLKFNIENKED